MTKHDQDPGYPPPEEHLILSEVEEAQRHARVTGYKMIALPVKEIIPRENIAWISQKDFIEWQRELIEAWEERPEKIKPIAVALEHKEWVILDGHHRWRAAKIAKIPVIWVVWIRGRLNAPNYRQPQRLEG